MDENLSIEIDIKRGLTSQEVEKRVKQGKSNKIKTKTSKSYFKIFVDNLFTWFNLICILIACILIQLSSFNNIAFLFVFFANLFIGLFQEIKAKQMVDKIAVIVSNKVQVLRDGKKQEIEINKVVEGDIIYFSFGDQICCDCVLLDGNVETNESLLTGESKPVKKKVKDFLLGGSFVVSGKCTAIAQKVGQNCYSSTLIQRAKEVKKNQSDILKTLNFLIKIIGFLLLPLGILTYLDVSKSTGSVSEALIKMSGSIISMMPVGMFLLTSVSLAVGVIKLAKRKTLVQEIYSIEMLARANVLCLDKTGTLTDGTMTVVNFIDLKKSQEDLKEEIRKYVNCFSTKNQTQTALIDYFGKEKTVRIKNLVEFNSDRKFSATTFKDGKTYMMGAPEFVTTNLTKKQKEAIQEYTKQGFRVVLFCKNESEIKKGNIDNNSIPLAIIVLQDNIRKDAKETIEWFNNNDVEIKVISGDNVDTVSTISQKAGIKNANKCVSLLGKSDEEVIKLATEYNVFGRVSPEQKCLIIKAIKDSGKKVAMTGDGVNDILALKEADCSIAMASGSEATRSASDLVMLENNFSTMPKVVVEGRRVVNNISKSSSLFLTKTFFSIFLTIFALISAYEYPLEPIQFFLWETLFIGIPAFLLALQPNKERIKGTFIGSLTSKALPGALVLFLSTMACYVFAIKTNNMDKISTIISYTVTFGAFFILFNLCLPLDRYKFTVAFGSLFFTILTLKIIPGAFFEYLKLNEQCFVFLVIVWMTIFVVYSLLRVILEKLFKTEKIKKEG